MGTKVAAKISSAIADKTVTAAEAKRISKAAAEEAASPDTQAQLQGLLKTPDVTFAPVARRVVNQALPLDQQVSSFELGDRPPTAIEKFWKVYFPNDAPPTDRGMTRILQLTSTLVTAGDNRAPFWDLECLLRLYKTEFSKENREANGFEKAPEIGDAYDVLKEFEDAIGKSVEPSTAAESEKYRQRLATLRKEKWTLGPDGKVPAVEQMLKSLAQHDFGKDEDDDKLLRRGVFRQVKKVGTEEFHMEELQGDRGVHELRRQLRWLPYNTKVASLNGGVQVNVPPELASAFASAHGTLGTFKDRGERADSVARTLMEQNAALTLEQARAQATAQLGDDYSEESITRGAQAIYDQLRQVYERCKADIEAALV
ncbi:MAG: hypothetical protein ACYC8T_37940 [Myxococcaceae bacterium]